MQTEIRKDIDLKKNKYNHIKTKTSPKTKAILIVSFGTSYDETRKKTIDVIEQEIGAHYPKFIIYHAWTSKMIITKLKTRDNLYIPTVCEAMEQIISDGIQTLIVQPTHILNGIENDLMIQDVLSYKSEIPEIAFGTPLLTTTEDSRAAIQSIAEEFQDLRPQDVLVLMGHGTPHYANTVYAALDYTFKDLGYSNIFMGTVEAYPTLQSLIRQVKKYKPEKVILAPFMIVAGDHARNDMASDEPDSWRNAFEKEGFNVSCIMKGLGEYKGIRRMFLEHVQAAILQCPANTKAPSSTPALK